MMSLWLTATHTVLGFKGCVGAGGSPPPTGPANGDGLVAGENDGGGLGLYDLPQVLFGQVSERASLPLAVVAFCEVVVDRRMWAARGC